MPDLIVKAALIVDLANTLAAVELLPPATPKGRYVLSKAAKASIGPAQFHLDRVQELRVTHASKDGSGKPVVFDVTVGGQPGKKYDIPDEIAFTAAIAAIGDEDITLSGCRMITHAELGTCPITAAQERVLIAAGLLEDKEPE